MAFRKAPAPVGSLEAYLRRAGLPAEAALAATGAEDPATRMKLETAVHGHMEKLPISPDIGEMRQLFTLLLGSSMDLVTREHRLGPARTPVLLVCLEGATDRDLLERGLAEFQSCAQEAPSQPEALVDWLAIQRSSIPETAIEQGLDQLIKALLDGHTTLFIQGATRALNLTTPHFPARNVSEPTTEGVVRGPREGFTESILTNIALLRRRIRDPRLRVDCTTIGEITHTRVAVCYVAGICQPEVVAEVKLRLSRIKIDGILESGYLEEFIQDTPWTVFPLIKSTERPDVITAALIEGRVIILTDGTPFALSMPTSFSDMMQAPDDYYHHFSISIFIRLLRWLFASIALLGPAFYVAFTTYHQEMLPHQLLLSIMNAREGVPFPAAVEALMMEIAFEALREAGVRMPKQIGQAISIVGALVIGQAAVQAGIVSAPMVIVVSLTGLASFVIPKFNTSISMRLLRFVMLFLAGTFGAYGITLGVMCILIHLASLRSFGNPYYVPMAPLIPEDLDDAMIRAPLWANRTRPSATRSPDKMRVSPGLNPLKHIPPTEEEP